VDGGGGGGGVGGGETSKVAILVAGWAAGGRILTAGAYINRNTYDFNYILCVI
jgi:hypothetical protein